MKLQFFFILASASRPGHWLRSEARRDSCEHQRAGRAGYFAAKQEIRKGGKAAGDVTGAEPPSKPGRGHAKEPGADASGSRVVPVGHDPTTP